MSKSLGNILDPIEIINKYGIDQLRYYLVKEVSLGNDGSISMENLKNCINNDLTNNYGNLCQRVFSFVKKNCASVYNEYQKLHASRRRRPESHVSQRRRREKGASQAMYPSVARCIPAATARKRR